MRGRLERSVRKAFKSLISAASARGSSSARRSCRHSWVSKRPGPSVAWVGVLVTHARAAGDRALVEALELAAEHRRMRDRRMQHVGQAHVAGKAVAAIGLGRQVKPWPGQRAARRRHARPLAHRFRPQVRLVLGSNEAIKEAVAGGLGVAIVSAHALRHAPTRGVVTLDIAGFPIASNWHIVYPSGRRLSPVAKVFEQHLMRHSQATTTGR